MEEWRRMRQMQILEWTTRAKHFFDESQNHRRISADFGKVGIQSSFLLNGGALAALVPLIHSAVIGNIAVGTAAILFALGLVLVFFGTLCAYINFSLMAERDNREGNRQTTTIDFAYTPPQERDESRRPGAWPDERQKKLPRRIDCTQYLSVALISLSFIAFVGGVTSLIVESL